MLLRLHNAGSEFAAPFLRSRKRDIGWLILVGLGQAGGNIVVLLTIKYAARHLVGHRTAELSLQQTMGIVALLIVFVIVRSFLDYQKKLRSEQLGQEFAHETRVSILNRLKLVSARDLQRQGRGVMILRLTNDLTALRQWVTYGVARLVVAGVSIVGSLAALAFLSVSIALPVTVVLLIGVALSAVLGRPLGESVAEARRRRGQLSNSVSERVANMAAIQAHGHLAREIERLAAQSMRVAQSMIARARYSAALRAISEGTTAFASMSALLFGAYLTAKGHVSASAVLAALTVVGLLTSPVRDFERMYEYWYGADVAASKLRTLFRLPTLPLADKLELGIPSNANLQVSSLNAGVVKGFTAEAHSGEKVVIVGPPGSGKSTLCLTIAGLNAPDAGFVSIGGLNINAIERDRFRQIVSIVSPAVPLFRGNILRNLLYRKPDASPQEVARACRLTGLEQVLSRLPLGAETRLAEGGLNLSDSERQHVSLTRAIVGQPAIIVIDAPNIQDNHPLKKALLELMKNYTGTVIVATEDRDLADCATTIWALGSPVPELQQPRVSQLAVSSAS